MQTIWDSLQQVIRILLYAGAGALVTAGVIDQATSVALAGALLGVINGVWTVYWNQRQVATVAGLKASDANGTNTAAATIERVKTAGK